MDKSHVIDAALRVAGQAGSWDAVHLHDVARAAGMSLADLTALFPTKDDIAEGWFDRADAAMQLASHRADWEALPVDERLHKLVMAWLDALVSYRNLVPGMLAYKLHPEHVHLASRGAERISRTVQTMRETARLKSTGFRREAEEAALTSIYLATFTFWTKDSSPGSERTRNLLAGMLRRAGAVATALGLA